MEKATFGEFYSALKTEHLETIYQTVTSDALDGILQRFQSTSKQDDVLLKELLEILPAIVFDLSAVMSVHLLHSYHEWLIQHYPFMQKQDAD